MLWSELIKKQNEVGKKIYNVEIDKFSSDVLGGLKEIGILAKLEPGSASELDCDVLDIILSHSGSHIDTNIILEIPFAINLSPDSLIALSTNCEMDISLLPPEDNSDWDEYTKRVCALTKSWLNYPNASTVVLPSSGFYEYLVSSSLGYKPTTLTDDEYMQLRFVDGIDMTLMDKLKDELQTVIYDFFDGEDEFIASVHSIGLAAAHETVNAFENMKKDIKENTAIEDNPEVKENI